MSIRQTYRENIAAHCQCFETLLARESLSFYRRLITICRTFDFMFYSDEGYSSVTAATAWGGSATFIRTRPCS